MASLRLAALLLVCALAAFKPTSATPSMWVANHLAPVPTVPANLTCIDHPEVKYGGHAGPQGDTPGIVFTLTNSAGALVTTVVPGLYSLKVTLPANGNVFLTTAAGNLTTATNAVDPCKNGSRFASSTPALTFTQTLSLSCPQLNGTTSFLVRATTASNQGQPWFTNRVTFNVDLAAYNAGLAGNAASWNCTVQDPIYGGGGGGGGGGGNTTTPVYPSCIGAKLLPNPCPVGYRCYYDTECKPQTGDPIAPACENAVDLPNPWAKGKCCFYDSQCHPQCEDTTNSKCAWLPKCATTGMTGCGLCSATNSSACDQCFAGYVLNLSTRKCDCAPGYWGSSSCAKCAAGSVSYGGKMPTAACTVCPSGRVANAAQTECVVASAWDHWGYDLTNRRWGYAEKVINSTTVSRLAPKWSYTAGSDISATPTIVGGKVYFPDWSGMLWCLDANTGATIWSKRISDLVYAIDPNPYPPAPNSTLISRTSPAVSGTSMVVSVMKKGGGYPYLFVLRIADGSIIWGKRLDPHPAAMLTQSPTIYAGYIYQGVSSLEELWAASATYPCCSFRGSVVKLDLATGAIIWQQYMAPANSVQFGNFSGNSVWGSSPAIDVRRNQIYIGTGNNYEIGKPLETCLLNLGTLTTANAAQAIQCEQTYGKDNYHNSMVALDMTTGKPRWVKQLGGPDAWNGACMSSNPNPNCAKPGMMDLNSPDYDFAQAPMLVTACKGGYCKQLVVAGQKSGWLWALNPENGDVHWSLPVGPGGTVGGLQWGSAADNSRIYVANNNYLFVPADLTVMNSVVNWNATTNQRPPTTTDGGLAAAIDAYSGKILWTFANPLIHWESVGAAVQHQARSQAPMTVAGDVVYYPSMDPAGTLFMLHAKTGKLLGSFQTGATTGCGPSIVDGKLYIGSGYTNFGLGQQGNKLHMMTLGGV